MYDNVHVTSRLSVKAVFYVSSL